MSVAITTSLNPVINFTFTSSRAIGIEQTASKKEVIVAAQTSAAAKRHTKSNATDTVKYINNSHQLNQFQLAARADGAG